MKKSKKAIFSQFFQICIYLAVFAASLFLSAGNSAWPMGWVFLAINAFSMLSISIILILTNPGLLKKRTEIRGKRNSDRILAGIITFFGPIAICTIAGMNARYHWLPTISFPFQLAGIMLAIIGCGLSSWAIYSNRFFYGFLQVAREENHSVCDRGAYQLIRHPGYLGAVFVNLTAPLILHSFWAFIPSVLTVMAIIQRTKLEDCYLQNNLDGYLEYSGRVRFRLIPHLW